MKTSPFLHLMFLISTIVLLSETSALGQPEAYYSKNGERANGYWRLKTDMAVYGTQIQFYSADSQLIYQESLPNRFIELNSKNSQRLDETLARLLNNQLVASSVPTSKLPFLEVKPMNRRKDKQSINADSVSESKSAEKTFQVQFISPSAKKAVHLVITNPTMERLVLTIRSVDNTVVYEHITHLGNSRHHLNFSDMPPGIYRIQVKSAGRQYQQPVRVVYRNEEVVVQSQEKELLWDSKPLAVLK
jgi:hypothetical protein